MLRMKRMNIRPTEVVAALLIVAGFALTNAVAQSGGGDGNTVGNLDCWIVPSGSCKDNRGDCRWGGHGPSGECTRCQDGLPVSTVCVFRPSSDCPGINGVSIVIFCGKNATGSCLGDWPNTICQLGTPPGWSGICPVTTGCGPGNP